MDSSAIVYIEHGGRLEYSSVVNDAPYIGEFGTYSLSGYIQKTGRVRHTLHEVCAVCFAGDFVDTYNSSHRRRKAKHGGLAVMAHDQGVRHAQADVHLPVGNQDGAALNACFADEPCVQEAFDEAMALADEARVVEMLHHDAPIVCCMGLAQC